MQAEYTTLADYGTDEFVEKRSRFIGYAKPVTTEEEAIAFVNEIRAQHREALALHRILWVCLSFCV